MGDTTEEGMLSRRSRKLSELADLVVFSILRVGSDFFAGCLERIRTRLSAPSSSTTTGNRSDSCTEHETEKTDNGMYTLKRKVHAMSSADSLEELDSLLRQTIGGRPGGLGVVIMAMFVMGQSSGSGILALPRTLENTGPIGFVILCVSGLTAAYTGTLLAQCWLICERRYPELLKHTADPYATIGQKAAGVGGRTCVLVANNVTIFGSCVVYILLSSGLISDLTQNLAPQRMPICTVVLILGACIIPLSWLGTPIDFWPVSYIASLTTVVSCILIPLNLGKAFWSKQSPQPVRHDQSLQVSRFFMGLGTIIYSFSGHMAFPTLQQDMRRRKDFWKSIAIAFTFIFSMYGLVTITSTCILGNAVDDNILETLGEISPGTIAYTAQILIVSHLLSGYLVLFNPLCQDAEKLVGLHNRFSLGRVCVRTGLMVVVVFVALSVPKFSAVMALVGGSALNLVTYILPVVFYECLCRRKGDWPSIHIPLHVTVFHVEVVLVVTVCGLGATIASVSSILEPDTFVTPCYMNMTAADST